MNIQKGSITKKFILDFITAVLLTHARKYSFTLEELNISNKVLDYDNE